MSSSLGAPSLQLHSRHASPRRHSPLLHPLFIATPWQRPHRTPLPLRALSRRFFLPSASFIWDAIAGGSSAREASSAIRRGMLLFRQGDVGGSLAEFDRAIELDPRQRSYLWQRGLSLYYLNRFKEGAEQFRIDVAENPNDTEESIWCFLCEAQLYGVEEGRRRFLQVGRDPRPFMREAYNMFKDGGDPEKEDTKEGTRLFFFGRPRKEKKRPHLPICFKLNKCRIPGDLVDCGFCGLHFQNKEAMMSNKGNPESMDSVMGSNEVPLSAQGDVGGRRFVQH